MQHALFTAQMISLYLAFFAQRFRTKRSRTLFGIFLHGTMSFPETSLLAGSVLLCPAVQSELVSFARKLCAKKISNILLKKGTHEM